MSRIISFTATILRFEEQGEKTGWSYLSVPAHLSQELLPGNKKSFHVRGRLDGYSIQQVSLLPMGGGDFIMAFNAAMRKGTGKRAGATVEVVLEPDKRALEMPQDFAAWLEEDEAAKTFFHSIPQSHRNYWIKWLTSVKGDAARMSRLERAVGALSRGMGFAEMLRAEKAMRTR